MKDTFASVRLSQKPQNSFSCYRCGRVILIADYLEGINIQVNCNRCGFKKRVETMKIEKKENNIKSNSKHNELLTEEKNEILNT
ncbi:hypothetical protein [Spiroplasma sp. AdecLV25b]|uniref:hypothetical protein n=1 Tax=Spiroplasma sp. AdecLV25b TaxID=3027162 RepID=UPI0027E10F7F|nr:hypothetical protein [Spiroplasma sp. AdecLV25b]